MPRKKRKLPPGQIFKAARLAAGFTQAEAAAKAGIRQNEVSRVEAGKGAATIGKGLRLAKIYGLAIDDLI